MELLQAQHRAGPVKRKHSCKEETLQERGNIPVRGNASGKRKHSGKDADTMESDGYGKQSHQKVNEYFR